MPVRVVVAGMIEKLGPYEGGEILFAGRASRSPTGFLAGGGAALYDRRTVLSGPSRSRSHGTGAHADIFSDGERFTFNYRRKNCRPCISLTCRAGRGRAGPAPAGRRRRRGGGRAAGGACTARTRLAWPCARRQRSATSAAAGRLPSRTWSSSSSTEQQRSSSS